MHVDDYFKSVSGRLQQSAKAKTVYGDAVEVDGKKVIPVSRIMYGFGGGPMTFDEEEKMEAFAGGGGGVHATPVGVFEITPEETRFIPTQPWTHLLGTLAMGLIGGYLLGKALGSRRR